MINSTNFIAELWTNPDAMQAEEVWEFKAKSQLRDFVAAFDVREACKWASPEGIAANGLDLIAFAEDEGEREDFNGVSINAEEFQTVAYEGDGGWYLIDDAARFMDDDLRERVHAELAPCTAAEFITRYAELHDERHGDCAWADTERSVLFAL